jgi:hypothetical protein
MPSTEAQVPVLSVEEWEIIGDLLRREARNLPVEIRHTDIRTAREALRRELHDVEALLEKLGPVLKP